MTAHGNFKEVPIGHEFKFGTYIAVKISATHGKITFANGSTEDRYIYPTQWVEYNPFERKNMLPLQQKKKFPSVSWQKNLSARSTQMQKLLQTQTVCALKRAKLTDCWAQLKS